MTKRFEIKEEQEFKKHKEREEDPFDAIGQRKDLTEALNDYVQKEVQSNLPDSMDRICRAMAHYAAIGYPDRVIAKQLRVPTTIVTKILSSEQMKKEVLRMQDELYRHDYQKIFQRILPVAVNTAFKVMTSKKTKENVRVEAAFKFMDRALGKPKETVENKTTLVSEVMEVIAKKAQEQKPIDAEFAPVEKSESVQDDPLEAFLRDKGGAGNG